MEIQSPFTLMKELEGQVVRILSGIDAGYLTLQQQKMVNGLKRELTDARLDTRDYELSETRAEQLDNAAKAKKRLDGIRKDVLAASEHNVFSAIDVAHITAQLEHIGSNLR